MIDLNSLYPEFESMIDFRLRKLSEVKANQLGPLCEELCVFYRTTAIAALLLELDIDRFYHMLIRSGLTRIFLLQKMTPEEKEESRFARITRAKGFFDSVAANRFDVAEKVALLSPQNWNEKYEYEDDYCYILFLHETITRGDKNVMETILERFEKVLEGQPSPRFNVCQAFLELDREYFDDAFSNLLDVWTEEIEYQKKSISRNEVEFATARHVFVEGLALLRLAEKAGIQTREEYEYCPKEARVPMNAPFPDNGYPR